MAANGIISPEIERAVETLFEPDAVVELRAFQGGRTFSGYFDDHAKLVEEAAKLEDREAEVYVTLNELDPELLGRAANRARQLGKDNPTTADGDVRRRRWVLVDLDPARVAKVSSTDEKKQASYKRAQEVYHYLTGLGFSALVVGDSGNGYHILISVDLPNDDASRELVKDVLGALAFKFNDDSITLDESVHNAARISKCYGTTARKGDNISRQPHRLSKLLHVPESIEPVDRRVLEEVARKNPQPKHEHTFNPKRNGHPEFDLESWITEHGVAVASQGPWQGSGYKWVLEECPFNGHTDSAAYIVKLPSGAIAAGCQHNSCQGYRWQDLRQHFEPDAYEWRNSGNGSRAKKGAHESNSANSANSANYVQDESEPWSPPAAFHSYELPEFPQGVFPEWLDRYVNALSESTQTPIDLASMLALNVGAAAAAKIVEVEVWPGWREPANLYTATVLRSGARKTRVFRAMSEPLEEHEAQLIEETKQEVAQENNRYEVKKKALAKSQDRAAKSGDDGDLADSITLAGQLADMNPPASPRLIVDDASPEKLANLLAVQGGRINLMSAEGGVFDMMAGRYSQGIPNLDVYLKGHAGDPLRVDRVGRPSELVKSPALNMALAVQPDVLQGLADKPGFRGRGLLGRFLYSIPHDTLGGRLIKPEAIPEEVERDYKKKMSALYALSPKLPDGEPSPRILEFSSEAQDEMEKFATWIEPKLKRDGELGDMTDWAGKLAGAVARIAGVLHMLENPSNPLAGSIREDTVRRAVKVGRYLLGHAKYALSFMGADPGVQDARHILDWIQSRQLESFTKRDAFEGTKGRFGKVAELEPALELLEDHGYIRARPQESHRGPGRRPSPTYDVNPLWGPTDETHGGQEDKKEAKHDSHNSQYSHNPARGEWEMEF